MTQKNNNDRLITIFICVCAIIFGLVYKFMPQYYFMQGNKFLKQQNYVKAYTSLKKAYSLNKADKEYKYYYVQSLLNLKPTLTVQKEVFDIASGKDKDSAQQSAMIRVNNWRENVIQKTGDNYIEQAPMDSRIIRWDINTFPLKITIVNNSSISIPDYYRTEIIRAFNQWQSSTGFIKFQYTDNAKDANITVEISNLPDNICSGNVCKYVVGYTTPDYKDNILKKMTITLYDKDPHGNYFSDKELYNTILHEIGHALGIMGHSYSSEDLMYMSTENNNSFYTPYRSSFQYLSSKDISTMKLLYMLVPDITNTPQNKLNKKGLIYSPVILGTSSQISLRKLQEAKNYIKNAPDMAGGYIDLGIAYAELNKTKDAIKAMKKAYELSKTNNEKYIASYNLAVVFLNSGRLDDAEKYANIAKGFSNSDEITELLTNINHAKASQEKPFNEKVIQTQ